MHDVMRKRLWRKLEALPDEQLYQVLDYIEFLEAKYTREATPQPGGLQRFAERLEDRMRARSLAPRAMSGTMKIIGTAGRMLDNIAEAGQQILRGVESGIGERPAGSTPSAGGRVLPASGPPERDRGAAPAE